MQVAQKSRQKQGEIANKMGHEIDGSEKKYVKEIHLELEREGGRVITELSQPVIRAFLCYLHIQPTDD